MTQIVSTTKDVIVSTEGKNYQYAIIVDTTGQMLFDLNHHSGCQSQVHELNFTADELKTLGKELIKLSRRMK